MSGQPGTRGVGPVRISDFGAANGTIGAIVFASGQFEPWVSPWTLNANAAARLNAALNSAETSSLCQSLLQSIGTAAGFWAQRDDPGFFFGSVAGGSSAVFLGFSAPARGNTYSKAFYEVFMINYGGGNSGGNLFSGVYSNQIVPRGSVAPIAPPSRVDGIRGGGVGGPVGGPPGGGQGRRRGL